MALGNRIVSVLLQSPLHPFMSGAVCLVRYTGRRSGHQFTTPAQYARHDDDLVILVAHPDTKTWWRNFRDERDLEILLRGRWRPLSGYAFVGADHPDEVAPLLEAYLMRFPKAGRALGDGTEIDRARRAVIVRCRPK